MDDPTPIIPSVPTPGFEQLVEDATDLYPVVIHALNAHAKKTGKQISTLSIVMMTMLLRDDAVMQQLDKQTTPEGQTHAAASVSNIIGKLEQVLGQQEQYVKIFEKVYAKTNKYLAENP